MEEQFKQIHLDVSRLAVLSAAALEKVYFPNHLLYFNAIMRNYFVSICLGDLNQFVYRRLKVSGKKKKVVPVIFF